MSTKTNLPTMLVPAVDHKKAGADMRSEREAKGLSLAAVARAMRLSAPYLSDLENGNRNWTVAKVIAYRRGLKDAATTAAKS